MDNMDSLFTEVEQEARDAGVLAPGGAYAPAHARRSGRPGRGLRPRQLVAQRPSSTMQLTSVILFGSAGTGKTSIAHIIAESTQGEFVEVSAIGGTVWDLRREIKAAAENLGALGRRTILFVDEFTAIRNLLYFVQLRIAGVCQ